MMMANPNVLKRNRNFDLAISFSLVLSFTVAMKMCLYIT